MNLVLGITALVSHIAALVGLIFLISYWLTEK